MLLDFVLHNFTYFLYGSGQMPIITMLSFNQFYVSTTSCFPQIRTSSL
jgi:hypothetical protein